MLRKKFSNNNRFRLSVSRTSKNISAQIIDDKNNVTILSASSNEKSIKTLNPKKGCTFNKSALGNSCDNY